MSKLKKLNKLNKSKTLSVALAVGLVASNLVSVVPAFAATHSSAQVRSVANKIVATTPTMINKLDPQDLIVAVTTENELNTIKYGKTEIPFTPNDDGTVTIFGTDLSELSNGTKSLKFDFASGSDKTLRVVITDKDATISSKYATFNNKNGRGKDVSVSVKSYGLTLSQITNDETPLDSDAYEVGDLSSSGIIKVTIKKEYLSTLDNEPAELYFEFVGGETAPKITVRVSGNDENQAATITSVSAATDTDTDTVTVNFSKAITEADVEDLVLTQKVDASDAQTLDATFTLADDGLSATAEVASVVATAAEQTVVYSVSYNGGAAKTATITVAAKTDNEKPVITLLGDATMNLKVGDTFTDPGVTITDNVDEDLVVVVTGDVVDTTKAGTYVLKYNVSDAAGNAADEVTRTVVVAEVDAEKPVITLLGDATMNLKVGDTFTDPGVTITDNVDKDLVAVVTGDVVDTTKAGSYTLKYNVSDKAGNAAAEVTRTVVVQAPLVVSSVSAINSKTAISVIVSNDANTESASKIESYVVKVGEDVVAVTQVTYVEALKKANLTVNLDGKEGKVTVNGVEAKDAIDYKTPEVTSVSSLTESVVYVEFSEKVDMTAGSNGALNNGNYAIALKGTALTKVIDSVDKVSDTKVRLTVKTVDGKALEAGKVYSLTILNISDLKLNKMANIQTLDFTAVKDEVKPYVSSVVATDGNKIEVTMSEQVEGIPVVAIHPYKADGTVDTAVTLATKVLADVNKSTMFTVLLDYDKDDVVKKNNILKNGSKYSITISSLKDLAPNTMEEQKVDFLGVNDEIAPTIVSSEVKDKKIVLTFSEKLSNAAAATYEVFDPNTGVMKYTFVGGDISVIGDAKVVELALTAQLANKTLDFDKTYKLRVTGVKDSAVAQNTIAANTFVDFRTPAAPIEKVELSKAVSTPRTADDTIALKENTVTLEFVNSVVKAEVENVANYKITRTDDTTKTLAVTKAVLNLDGKVTLTTALQDETSYKLTVSGLANLNSEKTSVDFAGVDIVAPIVETVNMKGLKVIDITFNEKVKVDIKSVISYIPTDLSSSLVSYDGTSPLVSILEGGKTLRISLADALVKDKEYTFKIQGVQDLVGNARVNGKIDLVSVTKTLVAVADGTAPVLSEVKAKDSATILVSFNEEIDPATNVTYTLLDSEGNGVKYPNTETPVALVKSGLVNNVITLQTSTGEAALVNGKQYKLEIGAGVKDLSGNAAEKLTGTFVGVNDEIAPKLVSAVASVKNIDAGINKTKVTLTFDEAVKVKMNGGNIDISQFIVTNANTFESVTIESATLSEDGKSIELILSKPTLAGVGYRLYVKDGAITDDSIAKNALDKTTSVQLFNGVDTTAPVLSNIIISGLAKDRVTPAKAIATVNADTITFDVDADSLYNSGTVTISEDVFVTLDAKGTDNDLNTPIKVTVGTTGAALTQLILAVFGDADGAIGQSLLDNGNDAKLKLVDDLGNAVTYTITVN